MTVPPNPSAPAGIKRGKPELERLSRARNHAAKLIARSRAVWFAKVLLPVAALVLLVALAVLPDLRTGVSTGRVSYHRSDVAAPMSRISKARYRGVNAKGEKFEVGAAEATQISDDLLRLSGPSGDITLKSGAWVMLSAAHGLYNQKSRDLGLDGKVTLYRDDGTTMQTRRATINLQSDVASGDQPVLAYGPFGTLHAASGFAVLDHGDHVLFKGPVHLTLEGAQVAMPASVPAASGVSP